MPENVISIDLSKEITQAEYCRRTGDTLPNLATKLKKMAVRDIPELGVRLIDISAPAFDGIRIEAPPVREYSIAELSSLLGNLLAKFKTDDEAKAAKIQRLERLVEEMTSRLEIVGEELDQQKQLNIELEADNQQKAEAIRSKDADLAEVLGQHQQEIDRVSEIQQAHERVVSDLKRVSFSLEEKEQGNQALKADLLQVSAQRDALQNRLLDVSKQVSETSITEALQNFRNEFLSILKSIQANGQPSAGLTTDLVHAPPGAGKTTRKKQARKK